MEVIATALRCKEEAKLQSNCYHQQTNIQPDAFPVTQPTVSEQWREKVSCSMDLLTPSSSGVFQPCLDHQRLQGEGCQASHQPSGASSPIWQINEWQIMTVDLFNVFHVPLDCKYKGLGSDFLPWQRGENNGAINYANARYSSPHLYNVDH